MAVEDRLVVECEYQRTVNYALQKVVTNGTGAPARALGRPVAAKTGSTDEYMSAWFLWVSNCEINTILPNAYLSVQSESCSF